MTRMWGDLKQNLQQLIERYRALAPRERLAVTAGAAALGLLLVYGAMWTPLAALRHHRAAALAASRALAVRLEEIAAETGINGGGGSRGGHAAAGSHSLLSAIDQSSRASQLGKAPTRIQPDGETRVRVWLDDVPFDALVRWLYDVQTRYGAGVESLDVEKSSAPGLVSARISFVRNA